MPTSGNPLRRRHSRSATSATCHPAPPRCSGQVPVVAAEDTRRTRGLLSHLGAGPSLLSFHAHSEGRRLETLLEILRSTAATSPWSRMRERRRSATLGPIWWPQARDAGITVVPIPGPSAVATALSAAGLPGDRYLFLGFVPRKGRERARLLGRAAAEEWSVVLFEAPPRLVALLEDLMQVAGPARHGGGRPGADQDARGDSRRDPGGAGGLLFGSAPAGRADGRARRHG